MDVSQYVKSAEASLASEPDPYDWLIDLRDHLTPGLELLDASNRPLLPRRKGEEPAPLRDLLVQPESSDLRAALHRARQSREVEFATLEDLRFAMLLLDTGPLRGATLVLSEPIEVGLESERRDHLRRIARWLADVIASRKPAAPSALDDWRELSVLQHVLDQAVVGGAERDVMLAFVEAVAVWCEVDPRAYRSDLAGRLVLDVTLAGADPVRAPAAIDSDPIPSGAPVLRLPGVEAAHLGFDCDDLLLMRIEGPKIASWTIAFLGTAPRDDLRLTVYADVLRSALQTAADVETSRLTWTMMQRLVGEVESVEHTAIAAATELAHATIAGVALNVTRRDGARVMSIGPMPGSRRTDAPVETLSIPLRTPEDYAATLVLQRPPGHPFTVREKRLGEVAASLLESWLSAVLRAGRLRANRRASTFEFDQMIDARAARASAEGADLSLIVFRLGGAARAPARESWISEIRGRLRPFDVAGTLTTGEIGVLLPDTRAEEAKAVVNRLRRTFETSPTLGILSAAQVGIASARSTTESLVRIARQQAASTDELIH
jgi:hypothetical protein